MISKQDSRDADESIRHCQDHLSRLRDPDPMTRSRVLRERLIFQQNVSRDPEPTTRSAVRLELHIPQSNGISRHHHQEHGVTAVIVVMHHESDESYRRTTTGLITSTTTSIRDILGEMHRNRRRSRGGLPRVKKAGDRIRMNHLQHHIERVRERLRQCRNHIVSIRDRAFCLLKILAVSELQSNQRIPILASQATIRSWRD